MFFFCVLGRYGKSNDRHRTKKTKHEFNRKKGKSWNDESNKKQIHTCKWKKLTKEWMKRSRQIHCLQGANPVYHRGNGPLGGTLAIFFWRFGMWWEIQRTAEKKKRSFEDREKRKKTWGKQPNCFIMQNLKRGFKCLSLLGRSCWGRRVGRHTPWADTCWADALRRFLIWILDLFFFRFGLWKTCIWKTSNWKTSNWKTCIWKTCIWKTSFWKTWVMWFYRCGLSW